jgi:hypothetical protein
MPYGPGTYGPAPIEDQKQKLRESGLSEDLINQILGMSSNDPANLSKMYEMSAYLRRGAFSPPANQSIPGAIAQGLMGGVAGMQDKRYADAVRNYEKQGMAGRRAWFERFRRRDQQNPFNYYPEVGASGEDHEYG